MIGAARDIYRAVKEAWDEDSSSSVLEAVNGPYRDEAPAGTELPYCIFKAPINHRREQSSTTEYWDHTIELELHSKSPQRCEELVALVGDFFDPVVLTPAIGTVLHIRRMDERYVKEDVKHWHGVLVYEILRSKPR